MFDFLNTKFVSPDISFYFEISILYLFVVC